MIGEESGTSAHRTHPDYDWFFLLLDQ